MLRTLKHIVFALLARMRRGERSLLIVAALFLCVGAQSQPSPDTPRIKTDQKTESAAKGKETSKEKDGSASNPVAAQPTVQTGDAKDDRNRDDKEATEYWTAFGYKGRITDWLLSLFTFCLVIVTIGLIGVGCVQWREARETAKRQLRAYVHVKMAQSYRDKSGILWAKIQIKNFGKTPAHGVMQWIRIVGVSEGDVPNFEYGPSEARGVIAPGGSTIFFINLLDQMTPEKDAALFAGRAKVYVWGEITYIDVFGSAWYTRYRIFLSGEGAAEGLFKTDREGNQAT